MSLLLTAEGVSADRFARAETPEEFAAITGPAIVPFELIEAALAGRRNEPIGVELANNVAVEAVEPHLASLELVAIEFPGFSDGRGFSLARRLRRAGFEGTLRAVGPLIADQFAEALACGFTEIELPDEMAARQPVEQWMKARDSITSRYQSGYGAGRSILEQRLAAQKA